MLKNKKICFRLTIRRIIGAILTAASMVNLLIVGAVFIHAPTSSTLTPGLTSSNPTLTSLISTSTSIVPSDTPTPTSSPIPTYTLTSTNTVTQTPTYTISPTDTLTVSPSPLPCTPQYSWPIYFVQRGDTLFYLAYATGSTVKELTLANCLMNDRINAGQSLYVPRLPIETPTATPTPTLTNSFPVCVEFEDLKPGTAYRVGETFFTSGISITVGPFVWGNGTPTSGGLAYVTTGQAAAGFGMEVQVNNVNITFNFSTLPSSLSLLFGEYGGNLNINVNGDFRNFENFVDANRLIIGGATVSVLNGYGNDTGYLQLSGRIQSFAVGGQELLVDNVCLSP